MVPQEETQADPKLEIVDFCKEIMLSWISHHTRVLPSLKN